MTVFPYPIAETRLMCGQMATTRITHSISKHWLLVMEGCQYSSITNYRDNCVMITVEIRDRFKIVNLGSNNGEENVVRSCLSSPVKNLRQEQVLDTTSATTTRQTWTSCQCATHY